MDRKSQLERFKSGSEEVEVAMSLLLPQWTYRSNLESMASDQSRESGFGLRNVRGGVGSSGLGIGVDF